MINRVLATTTDCRDGNCPTAYLTDHGTVLVQGWTGSSEAKALGVPEGEGGVEIPIDLLLRAAAGVSSR